ncbi:MAG: carbohydrate ABC transporter permease [Bacillota bacterium]
MKYKKRDFVSLIWKIFRAILLIGISCIILFPLMVKFSTSLMTESAMFDQTVQWIPKTPTLSNYYNAFVGMDYWSAFVNSFLLTITVSLAQLVSCTLIGYGFARFEFKGNSFFFALVIFTLIVPPQLIMVPLYLNFRFFNLFGLIGDTGLNLLNSFWPFVLTAITGTGLKNGLFIFIMRQFFKNMPVDLEEAAYVDGAGPVRTFVKIMLPAAIPALVIVFLFSFVWQWNDMFYKQLFLSGGNFLPFQLSNLAQYYADIHMERFGVPVSTYYISILNNTGMLMFILPLIILFSFLQRYFVESIERTGMVG